MSPLPIFRQLHHVCLVVRDLDRSIAYYESMGIGPWTPFPSLEPFRHDLVTPDNEAFLRLRYAFAALENVQIQLCQPDEGDTPQRRFLERSGEGVFHLGFTVEDCGAAERLAREAGLGVLMHGRKPDGSGFTYFDTADRGAGVTLEVRAAAK